MNLINIILNIIGVWRRFLYGIYKKTEINKTVFLVCSKIGNQGKTCKGKAK